MNNIFGAVFAVVILLTGCLSGNVGTNSTTNSIGNISTNTAPIANAGVSQSVVAGTIVTLNGAASSDANGDPLAYAWTLTSKPTGSTATLTSSTSITPTFTADVAGTYVASLVVNDSKVNSTAATVTVTAAVANVAPVANAGAAQNVTTGTLVTLNGAASSDANGDPLTYAWTLTSKPTGSTATLTGATSAAPTFTADAAGTYVASLVVNDGKVNSSPTMVTITAVTATIEGMYSGSTISGSGIDFDSIVLEDGTYYLLYGVRSAGTLNIYGLIQGSGTSNGGNFYSSNLKDFGASGAVSLGILSTSYGANVGLSGTVTEGTTIVPFKGTAPTSSSYSYNSAANLGNISGAWSLKDIQGNMMTMTIAANGSLALSSGGCLSSGTLTPRTSGKNVFDFSLTIGAAPCFLPGQIAKGIAIEFLLANGKRQFVAAGTNTPRTVATAVFGSR